MHNIFIKMTNIQIHRRQTYYRITYYLILIFKWSFSIDDLSQWLYDVCDAHYPFPNSNWTELLKLSFIQRLSNGLRWCSMLSDLFGDLQYRCAYQRKICAIKKRSFGKYPTSMFNYILYLRFYAELFKIYPIFYESLNRLRRG